MINIPLQKTSLFLPLYMQDVIYAMMIVIRQSFRLSAK